MAPLRVSPRCHPLSHNCNCTFGRRTGTTGGVNARAFDHLIERLRAVAAALPDRRTGDNTRYSMADIALAAFAVFFTQCPSFLSYQRAMEQARSRNNARSLFQVEQIPSDNHIRQTLDPVAPHVAHRPQVDRAQRLQAWGGGSRAIPGPTPMAASDIPPLTPPVRSLPSGILPMAG